MLKNHAADSDMNQQPKMYLSAHGPFHSCGSIYQFYGGGGRGELLDHLSRHVQNSDEPIFIRGEPGSGKSMLCQVLADRLNNKFTIIHYTQAKLSADRLLHHIVHELWPLHAQPLVAQLADSATAGHSSSSLGFTELQRAVAEHSTDLKPVLLIIDAPDKMNAECQELLERLGIIQRNGYPVFKIVVVQSYPFNAQAGPQNPGDVNAGAKEREWGVTTFTLQRLNLAEIHEYLQHHMLLFDFHKRHMFTREMSYFIADRSHGVFRAINRLARNAFMLASIQNDHQLSMSHLLAAGLPQKTEPQQSMFARMVRRGGLKFAIAVASTVVLLLTWWLINI